MKRYTISKVRELGYRKVTGSDINVKDELVLKRENIVRLKHTQ